MQNILKYLLEGLAIALAVYLVNKNITKPKEIAMIALVGAATFALLDLFAPRVGSGARLGAGFGLGAKHVGFGENFEQELENVEESVEEIVEESVEETVEETVEESVEENVPLIDEQVEEASNSEDSEVLGYESTNDLYEFEAPTNEEINKERDLIRSKKRVEKRDDAVEGFSNENNLVRQARNVGQILSKQARNLVFEGFQDADTPYENNKRTGGVLYSGDIVNLYESGTENSDNKSIVQRSATSSDILVQSEIDKVKTNLSN